MTGRPPLPERMSASGVQRAPGDPSPVSSRENDPSSTVPAIEARGLSRRFSSGSGADARVVEAVVDVDLRIERGEAVAIVGRSGAGKSTLLNLVGALDRGYSGELRVFGQELRTMPDRSLSRFRNQQIGFVFQSFNLLPNLSVGDNVLLPGSFGSATSQADLDRRARQLLADLGLADRFDQRPTQLSGGERQRVAIARALLLEPPLLVCDEPTGSLDGVTAAQILGLIADLRARIGITVVVVTHDPVVAAAQDRTLTLERGRIVNSLQPLHPQADPATASAPEAP